MSLERHRYTVFSRRRHSAGIATGASRVRKRLVRDIISGTSRIFLVPIAPEGPSKGEGVSIVPVGQGVSVQPVDPSLQAAQVDSWHSGKMDAVRVGEGVRSHIPCCTGYICCMRYVRTRKMRVAIAHRARWLINDRLMRCVCLWCAVWIVRIFRSERVTVIVTIAVSRVVVCVVSIYIASVSSQYRVVWERSTDSYEWRRPAGGGTLGLTAAAAAAAGVTVAGWVLCVRLIVGPHCQQITSLEHGCTPHRGEAGADAYSEIKK